MPKSFAQLKAKEILNEFGVKAPPVPIEEIIESYGLSIERIRANEKYDGELIPEKRIIKINLSNHINRQRFTLAHELGHWVLYHKNRLFETTEESTRELSSGYLPSLESKYSNKQRETEANYFASELLMPIEWIIIDWKQHNQNIKKLCALYQVSEQALWNKILEMGDF